LRSDPRRDVALIRTSGKSTALSIRHEPPVLGETVFAIGTPLEKEFQNTLTRGVVSGNRTIEGQPFIQSDVAVDHGNSGGPLLDEQGRVLALTDWGYAPDGVSHNLNFFIPIDDALRALGLSPAAEPPPQKAAAR
jgi:S1-C subfamily serine protease